MKFLARFSLKNSAAIIIICVLLMAGGVYSFTTTKSDLLPDIEFPQLSVSVVYPGASPGDVDTQVTTLLEEQFKNLQSLDTMTSQSLESVALIQLSFPIGTEMEKIEQEINDVFNETNLPENTTYNVNRFSFGALPIASMALFPAGDEPIDNFAEEVLKPELAKIEGVNSVALSGLPEQYISITVDKTLAQQNGISITQINEAISGAYFSFPAGTISQDSVLVPVRIDERLETLEQLESIRFTSVTTQQSLTLSEIATIEQVEELVEYARFNLQESLSLLINKKQDANTVEVAEKLFETLEKYEDTVKYELNFDQSEGINKSIDGMVEKGIYGAIFASIAVLIFLRNFRATLISIISIPLSLLIAAIFLKWLGYTLNIMSLSGMAVAIGRVVDDSIIVIENIYRKKRLNPDDDNNAITLSGTIEMISPILSSTIATIVVFLPLGLVGGITGAFFLPFAFAVVVALVASLFVAITIVPVLAKFSFGKGKAKHVKSHEDKETFYVRWYEKVIRWSLNKKALVISLAVVLLVGSLALPMVAGLGFVFLPNEEQKLMLVEVKLPASTDLEITNTVSLQIEESLNEKVDDYPKVFSAVGAYDFTTGSQQSNRMQYFIELDSKLNVDEQIPVVEEIISASLGDEYIDTTSISVQELQTSGPPTNNNVDINLFSNNQEDLMKAAAMVEQLMLEQSDLKYVTNNMSEKQEQWTVQLDSVKMREYNVNPFVVLGLVSDQTRSIDVGEYNLDGELKQIKLQYDRDVASQEELENILVFTEQGVVPLDEIADINQEEVVTTIQKLDGKVYAQITAQIKGDNTLEVTNRIKEEVDALDIPSSVSQEAGGGSDETLQIVYDLLVAIGVAIGLVYITLLIFFGKARTPFIILTSLLFVPIGSIVGLIIADEPISMSAMIGLLMLVGIVVTNAIVLIDRINQNRDKDVTIRESIVEAGKTRIRPILMTALATIAALLPLAFTPPEGAIISRGLAVVVIGGLTTSTFLTLIFLPVIYEIAFFKQARKERMSK
ncbi:efflux RND transporter permease subunit [Longirhabdus pacifica]|uniref:efflux RND transporter permease subunit n=1 Tax=Longirhabdus pacifica TaxID=2305227 RepID=UPI0010091E50|nr:efflux RND transporter permease subunit [Longirhabdus pacifica]